MLRLAGFNLGAGSLVLSSLTRRVRAADADYEPLNRYPRMVHEFFVAQVRESGRRNVQMLERLKTKADAEKYVRSVQEKIRLCFGPEPERTPLNPRTTGVVERDQYRIEKVIFDSRPGFPVTANLYIPTGRDFPLPGVVGTCGHSANGKAAEAYQSFAQGLARLGYICLIYDPIGQGERLQYVKEDLSPRIGTGTREHLYAGNQQYLVGEFFGMWRAWDGIRALDYLLTRDEVDPQHIGVTGNSGGGTMTTWLCGVERRWTMAAPSCFVTTFLRNLENELPADTEQCPPRALALGLDHSDFLAAMAPRPVIILAKERDYFDVRGSEEAYRRLRTLYKLFDAEEHIALFVGPTEHGYTQENREAMYSWFQRCIGQDVETPASAAEASGSGASERGYGGRLEADAAVAHQPEPPLVVEEDATLWCTPRGQVAELEGTRTVFHFTRRKSQELAQSRTSPRGEELRRAVAGVLKLPARPAEPPDYRIWPELGSRGYPSHAVAYAVDSELGIQAIVYRLTAERWMSRPPQAGPKAMLYMAHDSSDQELREEPLIRELLDAHPDMPFYTCDVRGIGESRPGTHREGSFESPYGTDYFYAAHSLMLDRPYVGQKTYDVLRVLDWLASLGHTEVHVVGRGWGALPATFAALFAETATRVTLKNALTSYADIAESEDYEWPLSALLPGVLAHFDLSDCYAELEGKHLRQIDPWGAQAGA
jgi:dienelactone hydrolase